MVPLALPFPQLEWTVSPDPILLPGPGGHLTSPSAHFPGGSNHKESTRIPSLGRDDPLEKGMATHSGILPWEIPRTEKPGGLPSYRPWGQKSWTRRATNTFTPAQFTAGPYFFSSQELGRISVTPSEHVPPSQPDLFSCPLDVNTHLVSSSPKFGRTLCSTVSEPLA